MTIGDHVYDSDTAVKVAECPEHLPGVFSINLPDLCITPEGRWCAVGRAGSIVTGLCTIPGFWAEMVLRKHPDIHDKYFGKAE